MRAGVTVPALVFEAFSKRAVRPQQPRGAGFTLGQRNELLRSLEVLLPLALEIVEEPEAQQHAEGPPGLAQLRAEIPGSRERRAHLVIGETSSGGCSLRKRDLQARFLATVLVVLGQALQQLECGVQMGDCFAVGQALMSLSAGQAQVIERLSNVGAAAVVVSELTQMVVD